MLRPLLYLGLRHKLLWIPTYRIAFWRRFGRQWTTSLLVKPGLKDEMLTSAKPIPYYTSATLSLDVYDLSYVSHDFRYVLNMCWHFLQSMRSLKSLTTPRSSTAITSHPKHPSWSTPTPSTEQHQSGAKMATHSVLIGSKTCLLPNTDILSGDSVSVQGVSTYMQSLHADSLVLQEMCRPEFWWQDREDRVVGNHRELQRWAER